MLNALPFMMVRPCGNSFRVISLILALASSGIGPSLSNAQYSSMRNAPFPVTRSEVARIVSESTFTSRQAPL